MSNDLIANDFDRQNMSRALVLAARGVGSVEPNPMVGCVIVRGDKIIGEGWHRRFGGPHAEVEALRSATEAVTGATMYVTLEPCCHQGKTPPCTQAIVDAGIRRVFVAARDPFPRVNGGGIRQLREAGVEVEVGLLADQAEQLNSPYLKLVRQGRPWIIAKWAMTWDGKTATRTGSSQWISGQASRRIVHELRGRMDAIIVGRGTAAADDPLLTARPPGRRVATRIVVDSSASLSLDSQLVRTVKDAPVILAAGPQADNEACQRLRRAGVEVWQSPEPDPTVRLTLLLDELGRRQFTNALIEAGGTLMGAMFDARLIDEIHVFLAPKLVGGSEAHRPIGGLGLEDMTQAIPIVAPEMEVIDGDIHLHGRITTRPGPPRFESA